MSDSHPGLALVSFASNGLAPLADWAAFLSALPGPPAGVLVVVTETIALADALAATRAALGPEVPVAGTTTSGGLFTEQGLFRGPVLGALCWMRDASVDLGAASGALADHDGPRALATAVAEAAGTAADRPGEVPDLVVMLSTPGQEEAMLEGIADAFGASVPVVGGSAADEALAGLWRVGAGDRVTDAGLALLTVYSDDLPRVAHQSGYLATAFQARVTRATGRRIHELDGAPAAEVYDRWTDGLLSACRADGRSVLAATTLFPLGRTVSRVAGQPIYALAHPASDVGDGAIDLFADAHEGQDVVLMHGSPEALVARAGRVARDAVAAEGTAGGLVIYCAGCSIAVGDRLPEVAPQVADAFGGRPVLGWFTFGEQGPRHGDHENQHANLMISAVAFPDAP